ncbi:hypothetical protein CR194_19715 [Salipaludibacillus keqinensis]|uniref:Uncharacterized protein n=1 Tax=Salipaludibacillus keqinensis TaxID=2045207 RepID=A0A323T4K6_9BACI|nr:hypothetical protein CR194_19715 [Salipaludibacillus keqinensis]
MSKKWSEQKKLFDQYLRQTSVNQNIIQKDENAGVERIGVNIILTIKSILDQIFIGTNKKSPFGTSFIDDVPKGDSQFNLYKF